MTDPIVITAIIAAVFTGLVALVGAVFSGIASMRVAAQAVKLTEIADKTEVVHKAVNSDRDKLMAEMTAVRTRQELMHAEILRLTSDNAQLKERRQGEAIATALATPKPEAPKE